MGALSFTPVRAHVHTHTYTHTQPPHACLHTHHVVDGQRSGSNADVKAAAGLVDGRRTGSHGAAVPCS